MSPEEKAAKDFAEANAGRMVMKRTTTGDTRIKGRLVAWRKDGEIVIENAAENTPRSTLKGYGLDGSYGNVVHDPRTGWCAYPKDVVFLDVAPAVKPTANDNRYPQKCPRCSAPAYVGLVAVDCSKNCKER
jgi:hypothetical protein